MSRIEAVRSQHHGQRTQGLAIDPARCTGCGWCVAVCPPHVLSLETANWKKTATLHDQTGCTGCALCAVKCPFGAITMRRIPDTVKTR